MYKNKKKMKKKKYEKKSLDEFFGDSGGWLD